MTILGLNHSEKKGDERQVPGCSIKITNARCEAGCVYCYEKALRDAGEEASDRPLDLDAVLRQMEVEWKKDAERGYSGSPPYLHGGEALLAGHDVIEKVLRKAYSLAGSTNIQTYGYLIDKRYIEMFKKYKTSVGISIDGPWPLNKARPVPGMSTKAVTELVHRNILWMRQEGIPVSIICILTKANATPEHLPKLKEWILWLRDIGVTSGRLNLMHSDKKKYGKDLELSEEEAENAWRELFRFTMIENDGLHWQPFHDAVSSVLGLEQGTCIFHTCEYFNAKAEPVILSDGTTANCLKTAKTGHMYPRLEQYDGDHRGFGGIRYEILPQVPIEDGGCKGCKHWRSCQGGCPAEGIGGDWRNRTRFCKAYYAIFEEAEKIIKRLIPNMRVVSEACKDGSHFSGTGVAGMWPPAWAYLSSEFTSFPSTWRGEARTQARKDIKTRTPQSGLIGQLPVRSESKEAPPGEGWISEIEHIDGGTRHLDSGHGDQIIHEDSYNGGESQINTKQDEVIQARLKEVEERIERLKSGKKTPGPGEEIELDPDKRTGGGK